MASKCLQRSWKAGNPLKARIVPTGRRSRFQRFADHYRLMRTEQQAEAAARNREQYERAIAPRRKRSFTQRAMDAIRKVLGRGDKFSG